MLAVAEFDERSVERAASQIVDQKPAPGTALAVHQVAMGKFNRRRGGFVQQSQNLKPRLASGFGGKKTLIAVRICRYSQHYFQGLVPIVWQGQGQSGVLAQLHPQSRHHFLQQLRDFESMAPDFYPGPRAGVLQTTFQRANDCPARLPLRKPSVPSVNASFSTHAYERRKPVAGVPVRSLEVDERIVTPVHGRSHDPGRTEIDSDFHR